MPEISGTQGEADPIQNLPVILSNVKGGMSLVSFAVRFYLPSPSLFPPSCLRQNVSLPIACGGYRF